MVSTFTSTQFVLVIGRGASTYTCMSLPRFWGFLQCILPLPTSSLDLLQQIWSGLSSTKDGWTYCFFILNDCLLNDDLTLNGHIWFLRFRSEPVATCDLLLHCFRRNVRRWSLWFSFRCVNRGGDQHWKAAAASDVCERVMTLQTIECSSLIFQRSFQSIQSKLWSEVNFGNDAGTKPRADRKLLTQSLPCCHSNTCTGAGSWNVWL